MSSNIIRFQEKYPFIRIQLREKGSLIQQYVDYYISAEIKP